MSFKFLSVPKVREWSSLRTLLSKYHNFDGSGQEANLSRYKAAHDNISEIEKIRSEAEKRMKMTVQPDNTKIDWFTPPIQRNQRQIDYTLSK